MDFYIVASCINIYAIHLSSTFVPIRRLKINVKLKEYHVDWNNTNKLFYLCKNCAIETHSRDESRGGNRAIEIIFLFYIDISIGCAGITKRTRSRFKALHVLWMKFNEWPTFFTYYAVPGIASAICLGDFLGVVNETRCKWNIREITDKDRND